MSSPDRYDQGFPSIVAGQGDYGPQELADRLCLAYAQFDEMAHWVNPHLPHTDTELITFSDHRTTAGPELYTGTIVSLFEARQVRINFPREGNYALFVAGFDVDPTPPISGRHLDRVVSPLIIATTLEEFTKLTQAKRARLTVARFPK
jgi:hypothetical protein